MTEDERIISRIKAGIVSTAHTDLARNPLSIRFEDKSLVLEGTVERISVKRRAVAVAREVAGGGKVIDRLKVKAASSMGDMEIARHVEEALDEDYTLEGSPVDVSVVDGVVYLHGKVHSLAHKRLTEVLAWWVPGTEDVVNHIDVSPPENDSDSEINETVRQALDKDKFVKDGNILIKTKKGVVTLKGVVKSSAAKDAAEDDVWCIPGIRDVVNNLEVR